MNRLPVYNKLSLQSKPSGSHELNDLVDLYNSTLKKYQRNELTTNKNVFQLDLDYLSTRKKILMAKRDRRWRVTKSGEDLKH